MIFHNYTALVTKTGDTLPYLAVVKGDLPTIEYLVRECNVKINGECNSDYELYSIALVTKIRGESFHLASCHTVHGKC